MVKVMTDVEIIIWKSQMNIRCARRYLYLGNAVICRQSERKCE